MDQKASIQQALDFFDGSPSKFASALGNGAQRQHVEHWVKVGRVPAERCPGIERLTGVRCELLRPDVDWAYLRGTAAEDQAREVVNG